MRSVAFAPLMLACAVSVPSAAAAQTGSEANLVLTIFGGTVTGHALWTVTKQPLTVLNTTQYDTLALSRSVGSSLVLGGAATYFISPHVGLHLEMSYLGLPIESGCAGVYYNTDAENKNQQICDDIQGQPSNGGAIAIFGGVTLRAAPRRTLSPYVRGNIGFVNQSRSAIEMAGAFANGSGAVFVRQVIADPTPHRTSVMLGAAAGLTSPLGPGYQFRFEMRDAIVSLDRLVGPANALGIGPTATRRYHHFALTLGFDIILERKRGRRY